MDGNIGQGIGSAIAFLCVVCFLLGVGIYFTLNFFRSNDIESEKPITPIKKLIIKNNTVDTIYIYKKTLISN